MKSVTSDLDRVPGQKRLMLAFKEVRNLDLDLGSWPED